MTIVGEITHAVNRIKSLIVPCSSRLTLIFFSSGRCFSCCLLGACMACSETVGFPPSCSFFDRLGWPRLQNVKLFGFPPGCSFFDREHDLRKILIRHHTTKNFWERNCNLPHWAKVLKWFAVRMARPTWLCLHKKSCSLCWSSSCFRGVNICTRGHAWQHVSCTCRSAVHTRTSRAVWTRPQHIQHTCTCSWHRRHTCARAGVQIYTDHTVIMIVHVRVHALVSLMASAAWPNKKREPNDKRQTNDRQTGDFYRYTSRPCRTLFGSCPPPALGSRKADMKTLSYFSPLPTNVTSGAQAAMKPRHHGRQSCLCLCSAPISFMPWPW